MLPSASTTTLRTLSEPGELERNSHSCSADFVQSLLQPSPLMLLPSSHASPSSTSPSVQVGPVIVVPVLVGVSGVVVELVLPVVGPAVLVLPSLVPVESPDGPGQPAVSASASTRWAVRGK